MMLKGLSPSSEESVDSLVGLCDDDGDSPFYESSSESDGDESEKETNDAEKLEINDFVAVKFKQKKIGRPFHWTSGW